MSLVLGIAVDVPLRRLFDYRPPAGVDATTLQPGVRLWVPFGRRRVTGVLVETRPISTLPDSKLRPAQRRALQNMLELGEATSAYLQTLIQQIVDDSKRGRVMALYQVSWGGVVWIGTLLLGTLAGPLGVDVHVVVVGTASVCMLFGLFMAVRSRHDPDGDHYLDLERAGLAV